MCSFLKIQVTSALQHICNSHKHISVHFHLHNKMKAGTSMEEHMMCHMTNRYDIWCTIWQICTGQIKETTKKFNNWYYFRCSLWLLVASLLRAWRYRWCSAPSLVYLYVHRSPCLPLLRFWFVAFLPSIILEEDIGTILCAERWCCLSSLLGYWAQSWTGRHSDTVHQHPYTRFADLGRTTGRVNPTCY